MLSNKLYLTEEERKNYESNPRIASVDLQEMAPIPGVSIIQGDITTEDTLNAILDIFKGKKA